MTELSEPAVFEVRDDRPASEDRPRRRDLAGLDGLRAIAVVLVILHHSAEQFRFGGILRVIADNGVFGVPIFFVLSGFLITYLLLREESDFGRVNLSKFYARRMIRILPPAYAVIAVLGVLAAIGWITISPFCLTSCVLFFRNYVDGPWISGHLWSLAVEEHFYLVWPLIFVLVKGPRMRVTVAVAAVAMGPVWRQILMRTYGPNGINEFRTDVRYDAILMGCLFALLTRLPWADKRLGSKTLTNSLFSPIVLIALILTFAPQFVDYRFLRFAQFSLRYLCVALLINDVVRTPDRWLSRFLDWGPIALVGRLSYSIYLWQQFFCWQAWPASRPSFLRWPLNLIPIAICASLSYVLIERPLFKVRAKFRPG